MQSTLTLPPPAWKGDIRTEEPATGCHRVTVHCECWHTWIPQPRPPCPHWQMKDQALQSAENCHGAHQDTVEREEHRSTVPSATLIFQSSASLSRLLTQLKTTLTRSDKEPDFFSKGYYDHVQAWPPSHNIYKATNALTQTLPITPKMSQKTWGLRRLLSHSPSQKSSSLDVTISRSPYIHLLVPLSSSTSLYPHALSCWPCFPSLRKERLPYFLHKPYSSWLNLSKIK